MKQIIIISTLGVVLDLTACQGEKESHEGNDHA